MTIRTLTRALVAAAAAMAALSLAACTSSGSTPASPGPIGGTVIAPVTMAAGELQGATVDLIVGQVLNISTGDLATDSYSGTVADTAVATFTPGRTDAGAVFNPGVKAVAVGATSVTLKNTQGGIQPLEFTVVVTTKN